MTSFTRPSEQTAQHLLTDLVHFCAGGFLPPYLLDAFLDAPRGEQERALHDTVDRAVRGASEHGWCPADLGEIVRRNSDAAAEPYLREILERQAADHPRARVHQRWTQQIDQLCAGPVAPRWPKLVESAVRFLAVLIVLPREPSVIPAPGSAGAAAGSSPSAGSVDETALRRVRGLLAKAESTEFPAEAEALSAKAHSLMREYAIDRAMAGTRNDASPTTAARRIWLDKPYLQAKAQLIAEVAQASRCRSVFRQKLGVATVLGFNDDLHTVELLVTSLLLQAERSMRFAGARDVGGTTRTRAFRQSFLLAYATRVGERLREASSKVENEVDARYDGALLPVLSGREHAVEDALVAAFPLLQARTIRAGSSSGWGAGRAAADLALLNAPAALGRRAG